MASGRIYDVEETKRLKEFALEQELLSQKVDKEDEFAQKDLLRYSIIIGGAIAILVVLKLLVKKQ
jgi:hypothetical protein